MSLKIDYKTFLRCSNGSYMSVFLIKAGSMDLLGRLDCVVSVYRNAVYFIPTSSIIYMLGSTYINDKNSDC